MNLEENTDRLCRKIGRPQWSGSLIAFCLLRSSNIEIKDHILVHVMGCYTNNLKNHCGMRTISPHKNDEKQ